MIGEYFIKMMLRNQITPVVEKYVKDPKMQKECIEGLVDTAMQFINLMGYREFIRIISYIKKKWIIQRVIEADNPAPMKRDIDVTDIS